MTWRQFSLAVPAAHCDAVEDLLLELGALAITLEDDADQPLLEPGPGETPLWERVRLHSLFDEHADLARVAEQLSRAGLVADPTTVHMRTIADQAWERAWMDRFQPMRFGRRLWIYPRHLQAPDDPEQLILRLDPGLAFGSGTHPTTALCLHWIDGADLRGAQVVDYGCGSGVLAIAAALCGAQRVWCVDHDPQALLATRENAVVNGVSERIITCAPEDLPAAAADAVLANILAGVLSQLAQPLCALMKPGASLVMSGMLREQVAAVQAAYAAQNLVWEVRHQEEWAMLLGRLQRP